MTAGRLVLAVVVVLVAGGAAGSLAGATASAGAPPRVSNVTFTAVSCSSASDCILVGQGQGSIMLKGRPFPTTVPAAARWDGKRFTELTVPAQAWPQGSLLRVGCTRGGQCMAVGGDMLGFVAEWWNGARWSITTPQERIVSASAFLKGLNAAHKPHFGAAAVSCGSATMCVAVGSISGNNSVAAERWNGRTWTRTPDPITPPGKVGLNSVSCAGASYCVAVGLNDSLAERWNGSDWAALPDPPPPAQPPTRGSKWAASYQGVSCVGANNCIMVGYYVGGPRESAGPVSWHWNGASWTVRDMVNAQGDEPGFTSLSCVSADNCTAVGSYENGGSVYTPVAERWNGSRWALEKTAKLSSNPSTVLHTGGWTFGSVSCAGPSTCFVGIDHTNLAEVQSGASWKTVDLPH